MALLITLVFNIVFFLIVVRIILSWVGADPFNDIVKMVYVTTDPILAPLKRIPLQVGMIDFTPVIAFIILSVLKNFLVNVLYEIAARIG
jgi:YggT family protein